MIWASSSLNITEKGPKYCKCFVCTCHLLTSESINLNFYLPRNEENNGHGEWEDKFHEHTDNKRCGPMAVGLDFSFPQASNIYGLSSHADSLSLRSTK